MGFPVTFACLAAVLAMPAQAHRCNVCETPSHSYCARWHRVGYCSREHQAEDWPVHQMVCTTRPADAAGDGIHTHTRNLEFER